MENLENQLQQAKQEIKQLKLENQKLKALLIQHNINVDASVSINKSKISKSNAEKLKKDLKSLKVSLKAELMFMRSDGNRKPANRVIYLHVNLSGKNRSVKNRKSNVRNVPGECFCL